MPSKKRQSRWGREEAPGAASAGVSVQVTFRHMPVSPAVITRIGREAQKLQRYADGITHCHVVVESPHHHHRRGRRYVLHLEVGVPGQLIAIAHEPPAPARTSGEERLKKDVERAAPDKNLYLVIRKVFDLARRRLQDHVRRRRGDVKRHAAE